MRDYKNLPNPETQIEEFNQYLRDNNLVLDENRSWILIRNSYIENQLVLFSKLNRKYFYEITHSELDDLSDFTLTYWNKHIYINAEKDKSVADRLHFHIKI